MEESAKAIRWRAHPQSVGACAGEQVALTRCVLLIGLCCLLGCGETAAGTAGDCEPLADFPADGVTAIAIAADGNSVVFGQRGVRVLDFRSGDSAGWTVADGMAADEVTSVAVGADGRIWAGHSSALCADIPSGQCGLSGRSPDGVWTRHAEDNSELHDGRVLHVTIAPDGEVWVGTPEGASHSPDGWGWVPYTGWQGCANPGAQCDPLFSFQAGDIDFASDGTAWLAIDQQAIGVSPKPGGAARRNPDRTTDTWDRDHGLPQNRATTIGALSADLALAGGPWGAAELTLAGVNIVATEPALVAAGEFGWVATGESLTRQPGASGATTVATGAITTLTVRAGVMCYATEDRVRCAPESCPSALE